MYVSFVATGLAPLSTPFGSPKAPAVLGEATKQAFIKKVKASAKNVRKVRVEEDG